MELTGPVVTSLSAVFAVDWYLESEEALSLEPLPYDYALYEDSNLLKLINIVRINRLARPQFTQGPVGRSFRLEGLA